MEPKGRLRPSSSGYGVMRGSLDAWKGSRISLRFIRAARCALCALCLLAVPTAAQTPQDIQRTAEQAIRKLDLQTELPREPERPRITLKLPNEVLWVVIAIALGVLLYAFRDMVPILRLWGREGAWSADEAVTGEVEARAPAAVLGAADELAAEGRFVEAMHVLLLQGLADIRARLDEQFADSLTSREILRSTKLSEAGRSSLRDIVNRVEWTYFGEHPAALADYVACRASFNALAQALHGNALHGSAPRESVPA
jgi:hypothetical protein